MSLTDLVAKIIGEVINPLIRLLVAAGFMVFLWGVVTYVIGSRGDEKKLDQGKRVMFWGIIGLFIMFAAWGIVKILCNFFGTCGTVGF